MRRNLLLLVASILFFNSANAQLIRFSKKNKDPHLTYSTYKPMSDKKIEKERKKAARELKGIHYSPEKSPHYNKREVKEAKIRNKRMMRQKEGKLYKKDKKSKWAQKDFNKKYKKSNKVRVQKIKENKKHYGTKASRKKFDTSKSDRYVLESDGRK